MLREIRCAKFRSGAVQFGPSLNVVLGDDNATNSIGKSTLLMVIDFAFGGDTLTTHNRDVVTALGDHDYYFAFAFDGETLSFRRGTAHPNIVYVCDDEDVAVREIALDEYTAILKQAYKVDLPDLSFRALVGLYFRVWGKTNLLVDRPLNVVPAQRPRECVDTLIKTFDRYASIRERDTLLRTLESEKSALTAAAKHHVVPKITKTEYTDAKTRIGNLERALDDVRKNLASYATNISAIINERVLSLRERKDEVLRTRLNVAGRLQRIERNLTNSRFPRSRSFRELTKFFPDVNAERLANVEAFHSGVANILREQLLDSRAQLADELNRIDAVIASIDAEMATAIGSVKQPDALVDYVYTVTSSLVSARNSSDSYERTISLAASVKEAKQALQSEHEAILRSVEDIVNDGMRRIVTVVHGEHRKSPRLSLGGGGYSFQINDDTGTGTAYIGLVLFDLTVFLATRLPAIAHDSILFKNIENDSVAKLLDIYLQTDKQSFIALDEIDKYGDAASSLLRKRSVIQLSDSQVLYVKDWRSEG